MPFYAVSNGRTIGIFLNWNDCNNSVKGYKNALYKKFENLVLHSKFRGTSLTLLPLVKLCRKKLNAGAICIFQEIQNIALTHALEIEMSALSHVVSKSPQNAHCPAESHVPGYFCPQRGHPLFWLSQWQCWCWCVALSWRALVRGVYAGQCGMGIARRIDALRLLKMSNTVLQLHCSFVALEPSEH